MALMMRELRQMVEEISVLDTFKTWAQRNDQLHYRCLHVKYGHQLEWLVPMYQKKLKREIELYDSMRQGLAMVPPAELAGALMDRQMKIERLAGKLRDTRMEIRGRARTMLKRDPIGTEYFIDLSAGDNGNTGLSPAQAWRTIEQYTTTTVRSPGDIAWVRANTTELVGANDINEDEDGTPAAPIYIIGCNAGSASGSNNRDPWGDDSDVLPIVDFNNGAYTWYFNDDFAWEVHRIAVRNSNDNSYDASNVTVTNTASVRFRSCKFYDRANTAGTIKSGIRMRSGKAFLYDCDIEGNRDVGLHLDIEGAAECYQCRFNGGATTQDYGIRGVGHGYFEECEFGKDSAHDNSDINDGGGEFVFKACDFNDFEPAGGFADPAFLFWEDCVGTPTGSGSQFALEFRTEKVEDEVPVGDSGVGRYSVKMTWLRGNYDQLGCEFGLSLGKESLYGPMRLWLDAGTYTIKVKVRATSAWTGYPTAAELYLRAKYYDEASSYSVAEAFSDEVLSDGTSWVDFEVQITTGREGPVYLDVFLDKFETGPKGVYVYPFPEVTEV